VTVPTPDITTILERVPGWNGRAHVVGTLDGGLTNRNVLVDVAGERFVVRIAGADTHLLGIDRRVERMANERAAAIGFAADVVAFVEPECCLVTRFVVGETLTSTQVAEPRRIGQIGAALRAFHDSGPLPGVFDCFRVPRQHREAAVRRGVPIPPEYDVAAQRAAEIEAAFDASPEPRRPCHNDLLAANFIGAGDRLVILDWEYAGMNDRYFDLGNLATNNGLDDEAEIALLDRYFGSTTPRRRARLALMKIMSDFREAMWAVVQQGISSLDHDYVDYAGKNFERLLANASAPGYRRLLADAAEPDTTPPS
jgi:thiamine kinase-like enzyme